MIRSNHPARVVAALPSLSGWASETIVRISRDITARSIAPWLLRAMALDKCHENLH